MPYAEHECAKPPENRNARIWRYMDVARYASLLDTRGLFFSRLDHLSDPFEGALTSETLRLRASQLSQLHTDPKVRQVFVENIGRSMSHMHRALRRVTFVNCWHMNDDESMAMWKLYGSEDYGVAIQSTFERLCSSLRDTREDILVGVVQYRDYECDAIPASNVIYPVLSKRRAFEFEKELRAVHVDFAAMERDGGGSRVLDLEVDPALPGKMMACSLDTLIETVFISPAAPEWYADVVRSVTSRYELSKPVFTSSLNREPVF